MEKDRMQDINRKQGAYDIRNVAKKLKNIIEKARRLSNNRAGFKEKIFNRSNT